MPLPTGTRLGPYEIQAPLGAGGMGEVYRARDVRLDRTVAVKILLDRNSGDPGLKQRFDREARTISGLQHPNICALFDVGRQDEHDYLVMEYVEGEALDRRLQRGPLPKEQVLRCAAELASALDKAHRQGVVHRDLKPGNIMLTRSGTKLLDFGLAKLHSGGAVASALTEVTVADQKLTEQGMLVGTFQYMAPEQLEGKEADARSDIFALGAVIHEMATGRPAFAGKSRASLIASILSTDPVPISSLQPMLPPALDRLVSRCLAKDPEERWQSAGDLASELRWLADSGSHSSASAPVPAVARKTLPLAWIAAGVLAIAVAALGFFALRSREPELPSLQAYLPAPPNTTYFFTGDVAGFPTISPQGDQVAFVASDDQGSRLIWVRNLVDGSVRSLAGTEAAATPFWSPDSKWLAYFAGGKLKRVALSGGSPIDVADAGNPRGGSWGAGDLIVFTPDTQTGLFVVPASGGTPRQITTPDPQRHSTHRWPYMLPDGRRFLYLAASHSKPHADLDEIYIGSIDGKLNRRLTGTTSNAITAGDFILYVQGSTLVAQPFDESKGELRGDPVPVAANVHYEEGNWHGVFDASPNGTLLYQAAVGSQGSQLLWFGRDGRQLGKVTGDVDHYEEMALSPDGKRLAVAVGDPAADVWVYDLDRGLRTRYTFSSSIRCPIWSPDGSRMAFQRGPGEVATVESNHAGSEKPLLSSGTLKRPTSWSPDGKSLLVTESHLGIGVFLYSVEGGEGKELVSRKINAMDGQFSPDGRWIVYTSQESGRAEVFVTRFPDASDKLQISSNGGSQPRWRRDGKAIYYWAGDHSLTEAEVKQAPDHIEITALRPLFKVVMPLYPFGGVMYDVSQDGQRFVVNTAASTGEQPLTLVTNWPSRLKK